MDKELSAVSSFLAAYLPPTAADFPERLESNLATRYALHWHPDDPQRGSAYRALLRTSSVIDRDIAQAAHDAGISPDELAQALLGKDCKVTLGERWTLWVDPGCVSLRIDRGDGGAPRDGQFIEIYGKLPASLRSHAIPLSAADLSVNMVSTSATVAADGTSSAPAEPESPVKRSKAIQILPPPGGRGALQAMTNAALSPDSPAPNPAKPPFALMASPLIIPPTPVRPIQTTEADVFSPTPASATSLLAPPRSPSPRTYGSLSPTPAGRPSSPLGMPNFSRRPSSRSSSVSSRNGDSDGEASGTDSIFSTASSLDSLTTTSSMWKGLDAKSRDLVDADGFKVPALPMTRPGSAGPFAFPPQSPHAHSRGSSHSSLVPPSPARSIGGTPRSAPGSPTKPRRRGVRGGQGRSESRAGASHSQHHHHDSTASISSLSSVTSSTSSTIGGGPRSPATPNGPTVPLASPRSRTETSTSVASTGTATEYSNGLVKVLGGGVLLGCAKSSSSSSGGGSSRSGGALSATPGGPNGSVAMDDGSASQRSRRGRERRRGGRGQGGQAGASGSGAVSPMGSFSYPSPGPISPGGGGGGGGGGHPSTSSSTSTVGAGSMMHASSPVWYPSTPSSAFGHNPYQPYHVHAHHA
ncbi:hypothetical protein JCM10212_007037 [Sporobolomyces blumeae]